MAWVIESLNSSHAHSGFSCGEDRLDSFLIEHALNNNAAGLERTFVAVKEGARQVCGYFTMAAGSVRFDTIPDQVKRRLPRYPIPTAHLAKLGVDARHQGKGLGEALLVDAILRAAIAGEVLGLFAVDVFAINDRARAFYLKYGFVPLLDNSLHLYLHIKTAMKVARALDGGS